MHLLEQPLQAPALRGGDWINTPVPLQLKELQGEHVVLIDFWDYTCVNCLHTLPYLKAWHQRYAEDGLMVIGIHTPEFAFAKDDALVQQAVALLQIPYPIVMDNQYATWNAYANRYWPAKYLIDKEGKVRAFHFGEGGYSETEVLIQQLLNEIHPEKQFPSPLEEPTVACYRATPELYLGYARGIFGNREEVVPSTPNPYHLPSSIRPDLLYLDGCWITEEEYVEHCEEVPGQIVVHYRGAEVNLVMSPSTQDSIIVRVLLDGEPLPQQHWGKDIQPDGFGNPALRVEMPRMYQIIQSPSFEQHQLSLSVSQPGLQAYAFTFANCATIEGLTI